MPLLRWLLTIAVMFVRGNVILLDLLPHLAFIRTLERGATGGTVENVALYTRTQHRSSQLQVGTGPTLYTSCDKRTLEMGELSLHYDIFSPLLQGQNPRLLPPGRGRVPRSLPTAHLQNLGDDIYALQVICL